MSYKKLTGINIQYPISQMILSGEKTIETRTYSIPPSFIGKELALIETPGKSGTFKSRVIAIIIFGPSFCYKNKKEFYKDTKYHCVTPNSPWAWNSQLKKWGWPIQKIISVNSQTVKKRIGIKYTKDINVIT